jgi:hypothetical protein
LPSALRDDGGQAGHSLGHSTGRNQTEPLVTGRTRCSLLLKSRSGFESKVFAGRDPVPAAGAACVARVCRQTRAVAARTNPPRCLRVRWLSADMEELFGDLGLALQPGKSQRPVHPRQRLAALQPPRMVAITCRLAG